MLGVGQDAVDGGHDAVDVTITSGGVLGFCPLVNLRAALAQTLAVRAVLFNLHVGSDGGDELGLGGVDDQGRLDVQDVISQMDQMFLLEGRDDLGTMECHSTAGNSSRVEL